jgi:hypothetical protein
VTSNLVRANVEMVRLSLASARRGRALRQYRRLRHLTDVLLDYLEGLNMRYPEGRDLDETALQAIAGVVGELPREWQLTLPDCETVQEALDQVFELKEEIKRRVMPEGYPAGWDWEGQPPTSPAAVESPTHRIASTAKGQNAYR